MVKINEMFVKDTEEYIFESDWFSHNIPSLSTIFDSLRPQRILEIGSFEGRSTLFFMHKASEYNDNIEIHCIDSWEGGEEHQGMWDMRNIESHFEYNMRLAVERYPQASIIKYKSFSHKKMMEMLVDGKSNYFDFIYIDGSHEAPDVLFDALLAHRLVRIGGVIAFDDYLWSSRPWKASDHYLLVKPAVDHYVNTYQRKIIVLHDLVAYQLYAMKTAE